MKGRQVLGLGVAAACAALVYAAWPKEQRTDEDRVRDVIAGMVQAAERKAPGEVADALSESFHGQGGSDKAAVKQLLAAMLLRRTSDVGVLNPSLEVQVRSADEAHFKGSFVFTGDTGITSARPYEIEGVMKNEGGTWRVVSATWSAH